jgi:hypothetical protein
MRATGHVASPNQECHSIRNSNEIHIMTIRHSGRREHVAAIVLATKMITMTRIADRGILHPPYRIVAMLPASTAIPVQTARDCLK